MADSLQSLVDNLPTTTGRSIDEWFGILEATGLEKHSELRHHLKSEHGLGHGFAHNIALRFLARGISQADDDLVAAQYSGAKAALRPLCDALVDAVSAFGDDVEISPKKTSVSLRRTKQFGLIEVPSARRIQVGVQLPGAPATERLLEVGGMCSHRVVVTSIDEVDEELIGWLRAAFERA